MPDKQEFTLYNGEVVLTFAEKSHRYKVSDRGSKPAHCPSVTTILNVLNKPALVPWAVRCACDYIDNNLKLLTKQGSFSEQDVFNVISAARTAHDIVREEAAEIGTNVHDWLHQYWVGGEQTPVWPADARAVRCIEAALDWFSDHNLKPVRIEEAQYSRLLKICGRPDFIGYVDGALSVLDYKSTKSLYPEVALQMTAYASMHQEEFGELPATRYGLRLDKESGEFEARCYKPETYELDLETFQSVFRIYDRLKHLRRKEKPESKQDFLAEL